MNFFNSNNISLFIEPSLLKLNFFFGNIAFISLFIAVLLYWFDFFDTRKISKKLKNFCMIGANISLAFLLIQRWYESGHFPLSNLYESLIGLSWGFTSVHLILVLNPIDFFNKITSILNSTRNSKKSRIYNFQKNFEKAQTSTALSYVNYTSQVNRQQASSSLNVLETVKNSTTLTQAIENEEYSPSSKFLPELHFLGTQPLTLAKQENILNLNQSSTLNKDHRSHLSKINDKIGAITAPTALLTSVFATFFLPPEITQAKALIPALKSNWLTMHVTVMVASYAFLLIGSLLSIAFCAFQFTGKFSVWFSEKKVYVNSVSENTNASSSIFKQENFQQTQTINHNSDLSMWLNNTSYRILGLGFPLLTIGILSGAVWANEAWGSYWSWDPKETWALITWLVFAVYFHSRYIRPSNSSLPATIASIGFVVIWICYLGVNLLGSGLHSYGWFNN